MELEFVEWLKGRLPAHRRLLLGVGDDAAIARLSRPDAVLTTDMLMDGVDFEMTRCQARLVGRKALAVNLSDLAAMAAAPEAALISLALPAAGGLALAKELYEGLLPLAEQFDVAIAGGDTNTWNGPLAISITLIGTAAPERAWRRSGARPGDRILVSGELGGSILGRHFDFTPRVREALDWSSRFQVRAAIDISDGLSLDLYRLCKASGVGALLDLDAIPVSSAARRLSEKEANGRSPLDHALSDGEDFELILVASPDEAESMLAASSQSTTLTCIGQVIETPGLWVDTPQGRQSLTPRGYLHQESIPALSASERNPP